MPNRAYPYIKAVDTGVFLLLSIFIIGSILFGYRTFAIPPSHHQYIACEEHCEKIAYESIEQAQHLLKFSKQNPYGWNDDTMITANIRAPGGYTLSEIMKPGPCESTLECSVLKVIEIARSTVYRPLHFLSVLWGLPFHFVFSMFVSLLMIASALLAEKTCNHSPPPPRTLWQGILFGDTDGLFLVYSWKIGCVELQYRASSVLVLPAR